MVLIQAGMMGVIINCTGIVFSAVLEDCGFRAGDLSVYYTIRSLASAAAVGVTSRLFFRYGGKAVMGALGWRMAAVVTACIGGTLIIIPSLVLLSISPDGRHRPPPPWNRRPEPLPFPPIFSLQTPQREQREPSVREGPRCFLFMVLWITLRTRGPAFPGPAEVPAPAYGSCGSPGGRPRGRF